MRILMAVRRLNGIGRLFYFHEFEKTEFCIVETGEDLSEPAACFGDGCGVGATS